jgi:putative (di)nucleoside polyphosphate hydrolase
MPQGGIDAGESPEDAAIRELYEETSIRSVRRLDELPRWLDYDLPKSLARRVWNGRYRGQSQRWFAFRFEGEESEIDVMAPGGGRHRPEFDAWRWEAVEAVPDLVIPFKRDIYRDVLTAFADFAQAPER